MSKKCILFVHGLGSNKEETWGDLNILLGENRKRVKEYSDIDFKYFEYKSSKFASFDGLSIKAMRNLRIPAKMNTYSGGR